MKDSLNSDFLVYNSFNNIYDSNILGFTNMFDISPNEELFAVHMIPTHFDNIINIYNTKDFSLYKKIDLVNDFCIYTFREPYIKFINNETIITSAIKIPTLLQELWFINIKNGIATKILDDPYY